MFENNRVILAKTSNSAPLVPTPTGRRQPNNFSALGKSQPSQSSWLATGTNHYIYRPTLKVVNQKLGATLNLVGSGGVNHNNGATAEFENDLVPKIQELEKDFNQILYYLQKNKKKQSGKQCELKEEFKKDKKYGGFAYKLDKSGNLIFRVETKAGSEILLTYDKTLQKYYHQDVYNLGTPKNLDAKKARSLKPKDQIKYLKKTVLLNKVIEFQIANAKSLSTKNLNTVSGFISAREEPDTLYINKKTGQVHFVNARTNIWITTVIKTRTGLINLAKNNFHLFPNAGK